MYRTTPSGAYRHIYVHVMRWRNSRIPRYMSARKHTWFRLHVSARVIARLLLPRIQYRLTPQCRDIQHTPTRAIWWTHPCRDVPIGRTSATTNAGGRSDSNRCVNGVVPSTCLWEARDTAMGSHVVSTCMTLYLHYEAVDSIQAVQYACAGVCIM